MNSFFENKANIYFLLWCIYLLKGTLYQEGTLINQGLLLIILLITLFESFSCLQITKNIYVSRLFRSISALIAMFTIYGIILFVTDGVSVKGKMSQYYIEGAYISLLPIYVTYLYTKKGLITLHSLQMWMILFVIVGICEYFKMERGLTARILENKSAFDEGTNNAGNWLLYLISGMLVFRKKPLFLYIGLAVITVFIIMAMKRGAILICLFLLLIIIRGIMKNASKQQYFIIALLAAITLLVVFAYIQQMIQSSDYFNYRLEQTLEGDTSNREVIYENFWNTYINQSDPFALLFGRGAWATLKTAGGFAHNDWLEMLINNGIIGAFLLFVFLYRLFQVSRCKFLAYESRFCLFLIFFIITIRTFISMSICGMSIYATSMLGFSLADGFRKNVR